MPFQGMSTQTNLFFYYKTITCVNQYTIADPAKVRRQAKKKTGAYPWGYLLQKILVYDFLRRHYPHQVIGSKLDHFLSACTQAPLYLLFDIIHQLL